ncbi:TRAM domain-containing protein [Haloterrigena sp. H1]|uniref:TRAM domain-containing protein n=1 Tax=Haloterrigena sp. H1 TaxID=2552943 RepID=UPI00110E660D|nr:TRAM domain-containing protein [Haloterrigena sp. H1]TMT81603.1 TRAM domain-containing protein [Haloterrigena sp. H1]
MCVLVNERDSEISLVLTITDGDAWLLLRAELTDAPRRPNHATESNQQITAQSAPKPPVEESERRTVTIEDVGEQGDGIARVERGYVIIVADAELGDHVVIEVTNVRQSVAFADVVEQQ